MAIGDSLAWVTIRSSGDRCGHSSLICEELRRAESTGRWIGAKGLSGTYP